jgi:NAD(P)-dependent dehydrogenase (short-subunit alcohol dehydrogenase family)
VAEKYHDLGATVFAWDQHPDRSLPYEWSQVDVASWSDLTAAADGLPPLYSVITCAGIGARGDVIQRGPEDWRRVLSVNVEGTALTALASFEALSAGKGTLVTIGSIAAINGFHGRAAYSASKAAVVAMTKSLANEWAEHGIRTVCVSPGFTSTPMLIDSLASGLTDEKVLMAHTPQRCYVEPEALADAVVALASDSFRRVTGAHLLVDAGWDTLSGF